jgi:hypothetical protein
MQTTEIINIASKADLRGFKQSETAATQLSKTIKNLARTLGVTFAASAVVNFGKSAATAFLADDKAAAQLTQTMNNLNLELSAPGINKFIERLTLASGVSDDKLRPAMQALLQTTGSVTASQKLLSQAMDVSASTGIDLTTTASDLAQAYVGNLKGLRKYNLGLTQAELKSKSFAEIQDIITQRFGGAQAAALTTYAGKMQLLSNTAGEAKEVIGEGLVGALIAIGGEQASVQGTADSMMNLAQAISDISLGYGKLIGKLNDTPIIGDLLKASTWLLTNTGVVGSLRYLGEQERLAKERAMMPSGTVGSGIAQGALLQSKKRETEAEKRAKELAKAQAAQTKALKEQAQIKKLGAVFDLQQIQIVAALRKNISDEERTKLELQSALLMGNTEEANRLIKQLATAEGMTKDLRTWLLTLPTAKNPFEAWLAYLDAVQNKLNSLKAPSFMPSGGGGYADFGGAAYEVPTNPYAGTYYGQTGRDMPSNLIITLDGTAFDYAVAQASQNVGRAGININGTASG